MKYKVFLRDLLKELLGPDLVLFTTDGNSAALVKRGMVDGTLTTVDFGTGSESDVRAAFEVERQFNKDGPLVNRLANVYCITVKCQYSYRNWTYIVNFIRDGWIIGDSPSIRWIPIGLSRPWTLCCE